MPKTSRASQRTMIFLRWRITRRVQASKFPPSYPNSNDSSDPAERPIIRSRLMDALEEVTVPAMSPERFRSLLGDRYEKVEDAIATAREVLSGRVIWHVNSTAKGGGVAELLQSLLAYARGAGVDVRWLTISGNPEFFSAHEAPPQPPARVRRRRRAPGARGAPDLRGRAGRGRRRAVRARSARRRRIHPRSAAGGAPPSPRGQGHQHDLALPRRGGPAREARARGLGIPPPLRGRGGRIRLLPEGVRLGRARDRTSLDRPSVDRRVLPEEPGPRAGCGRRHPGRCRHPAGGSLQSRSLPPIRREQRARRSCRPA